MLNAAQIAAIAAKALDDKKAKDVKILRTTERTVLADYFVICNGTSSTHIKALVDEVDRALSEAGEPPVRREGLTPPHMPKQSPFGIWKNSTQYLTNSATQDTI